MAKELDTEKIVEKATERIQESKPKISIGVAEDKSKPQTSFVVLKPVPDKIGSRPRLLNGSTIQLFPLLDKYQRPILGHTQDEIDAYRTLKIDQEFIDNYRVTINSNGRVYNLKEEIDMFELKFISQFNIIAKDQKSINYNTLFYIHDELEHAKETNIKAKQRFECMTHLMKMSNTEKIEFLTLFGHNTAYVGAELAEARLIEEIERHPIKFLQYTKNSARTQDLIDLNLAVEYRIVRKDINSYYYGDILLGSSQEEVLKTLSSPQHQKVKISIKESIEREKRIA